MKQPKLSEVFSQSCKIYWWNHGQKQPDINCPVGTTAYNYMRNVGITVRRKKRKGYIGETCQLINYIFTIRVSSATAILETSSDPAHAAFEAIKLFHTLLGDKTQIFVDWRSAKINWR